MTPLNPMEQPDSADIVIIGGGPAGTSAAWALNRLDPTLRVVLIEQSERLAAGSSTAALECYRTCWPLTCNAEMMKRSVEVFHHADEYLGEGAAQSIHVVEHGYLFCAFGERHAATLKRDVEELHAVGLTHIEFLDMDEVRYRFPWLGNTIVAAKWDPIAGRVDSNALVHRYAASAKNATVLFGVQDCSIQVEHGRVGGVRSPQGLISAPKVLIANGVNAMATARTAGVELPVVLKPRQSFTTMWRHDSFPSDGPLVIGEAPFPHVRPESGTGAMFGWEYTWQAKDTPYRDALIDPLPPDRLKDPRFPSLTLALLARQFKHQPGEGFASSQYLRGVRHNIGYYVYRGPDAAYQIDGEGQRHPYESERAIIGQHPHMPGLYLSVAHSGHGIMTSPAAGEIAARILLDHPLSHPSFADFAVTVPWVRHDISVL